MATAIDFDVLGQGHDIEVNDDGIVYQSYLYKAIVAEDGQTAWDRLMACVDDNIIVDAEVGERIDWVAVQNQYESE